MTTYPAYRHGLTIEIREGRYVVTNGFGGNIVYGNCDGLDDALDMRERYAIGFPDDVVELVAKMDAGKNRIHAARKAVIDETGEEPFRVTAHHPSLIRYGVVTDAGPFWGEDYDDHAIALERLLDSVREGSVQLQAAE